MTNDTQEHDIPAIRQLLLAAFTSSTLPRFCQDHPTFRPVLDEFAPGHGLADMVDELIAYSESRLLFDELLAEVRVVNPEQMPGREAPMTEAICPYCGEPLVRKPKRKKRCPHCDNYIRVREGRLLTQEDADAYDVSHGRTTRNLYERFKDWWQTFLRRYWPLAVILALIGALFAAAQIYNALTGKPALGWLFSPTPTPTATAISTATPTPTLTPSPTPFTTPAAEGEYLIIVAEFHDNSAARNLDVRTILAQAINDALPDDLNARAVSAHGLVPEDEKEARDIAKKYSATIILWGRYTDNLIEVNFTPTVALEFSTQTQDRRAIEQTVDELAVFVNDLAAGPVRWLSLLTIGQTLYLSDRYDDALVEFDAALALLETTESEHFLRAATYFYRANTYSFQGRYESAIEDYQKSIELFTDDVFRAAAYTNQGQTRKDQGDLVGAMADYNRAIELDPENAAAHNSRGTAHAVQGDLAEAIEDFEQAIALNPEYDVAYYNRGNVRREWGDFAGAIADYDRAIELNLEHSWVYNNRAMAREAQGDLAGALADFDRAIELDPGYPVVYYNRGLARHSQGDLAGALADYDQCLALNPDGPEQAPVYTNRGILLGRQGDLSRALADYNRAIALNPDTALAYYNRGNVRVQLGDLTGALTDYDRAITLLPDGPKRAAAYNNRGNTRKAQGDLTGARADYERALAICEAFDDPFAETVRQALAGLDQ